MNFESNGVGSLFGGFRSSQFRTNLEIMNAVNTILNNINQLQQNNSDAKYFQKGSQFLPGNQNLV